MSKIVMFFLKTGALIGALLVAFLLALVADDYMWDGAGHVVMLWFGLGYHKLIHQINKI